MTDTVTLAMGGGGKETNELINSVFKKYFYNPDFTADDAAVLDFAGGKLAFTTDGFIVSPADFPGGNIGKISICGTVNDLSCMGAVPIYLSCAFVIEEGFSIAKLDEIAALMKKTADEAGIRIVAGDTKVAGKGQVDGVFITTTGIGRVIDGVHTAGALARPGDNIIVTGDVGRHGCTILLARNQFDIQTDGLVSDCAPLAGTVQSMLAATKDIHVIRDATRGGVGTVLYEIAGQSGTGIELNRDDVPVDDREALAAFHTLCRLEGIIPALESSHALAYAGKLAPTLPSDAILLVNLSGRGDKDMHTVAEYSGIRF